MRQLTLGVVVACIVHAQFGVPVVSNITVDALGHSSLRLVWDNSIGINSVRVRYGYTADYDLGPGGGVFTPGTATFMRFRQTVSLSGLAPGQRYHFCPQSSADAGRTWSQCVDFTATTLPLPAEHPATPQPPAEVNLRFPDQTGSVLKVAADCGDLQEKMDRARAGDTILIPAGTICSGKYTVPPAPEAIQFNSVSVDARSDQIAILRHPFKDGEKVHLDTYGCLPGSAGPDRFCSTRGVLAGSDYFIQKIDADNIRLKNAAGEPVSFAITGFTVDPIQGTLTTPDNSPVISNGWPVQVRSTDQLPGGLNAGVTYYVVNPDNQHTMRLASFPGGPPIFLSSAGSGSHLLTDPGSGTHAIMAWPPPNDRWIVVRTATPDQEFCPEGVRCTGSIWASKMARIAKMAPPSGDYNDIRLDTGLLSHHWRFIGIEFTHADNSAAAQTSTDPTPYFGFFNTRRTASHIIFDRCYIHGLGYPNRIYRAIMGLDGEHIALINSDLQKLDFWHPLAYPNNAFMPEIKGPQTVQIAPGRFNMGITTAVTASPATITLTGGSGNGTALVYFTLEAQLEVQLPPGFTANCSGPPCNVVSSLSSATAYPTNEVGRIGVAQVADLTIANGAFTSFAYRAAVPRSVNASEGAQSLIAGNGPGPVLLQNNTISSSGLPVHFDDSGGTWFYRHDYVVRRNLFTAPMTQQAGGPQSDGFHYFHRNMLEWKGGQRILVEGNIFEHNFADVTPLGAPLVITPRSGGYTTDVMIRNNTFRDNGGAIHLSAVDSFSPVSKPLERVAIVNNLFHHNNGYLYAVNAVRPSATGILVYYGYAAADFVFDHNTVFDNRGSDPVFLHLATNPLEGTTITNNFLWINDDAGRSGVDGEGYGNCAGYARSLMDCVLIAGTGRPSYKFENNVLMPGWKSSQTPSTLLDAATLRSAYSGLANMVIDGSSIDDRLIQAGYSPFSLMGLDFKLSTQSQYSRAASDGRAIGADMNELEVAQGVMQRANVVTGMSWAEVQITVPDVGAACYLLYGTNDNISDFKRTAPDTSSSRQRTFRIDGLTEGGQYNFAALCSGASNYSIGSFTLRRPSRSR